MRAGDIDPPSCIRRFCARRLATYGEIAYVEIGGFGDWVPSLFTTLIGSPGECPVGFSYGDTREFPAKIEYPIRAFILR